VLSRGTLAPTRGAGWWSTPTTVLSRALVRVRVFSLAQAPVGERRAVLRNLLVAWSPFADSAFLVAQREDRALAFAWDAAAAAGAPLPESLLQQPMAGDGCRLVRGLEGCEAQLWRGGWPVATRWWPEPPSTADWQEFARTVPPADAALLPAAAPAPQAAAWRAGPWVATRTLQALSAGGSRIEHLATVATIFGLLGLTAAQARVGWDAWRERQTVQAALAAVESDAAPVRAARDRALAAAAGSALLARELSAVQPLEVLQQLSLALPARGAQLRDFELEGLRLRLGLELAADVQRATIVKDLQAGGWFTAVTEAREQSGRPWAQFEATLAGLHPPARPAADAAGAAPAAAAAAAFVPPPSTAAPPRPRP